MLNNDGSKRFIALDVFRGSTIIMMILVNMPGSYSYIYPLLVHAPWEGCTLADIVFPFFLFSVGVSGFLSSHKYKHNLSFSLVKKIICRTVLLFTIGILINAYPFFNTNEVLSWNNVVSHWSQLRFLGVLQRIGLAYCGGMLLCCWLQSMRAIIMISLFILVVSWLGFIIYNPLAPYDIANNISRAVDVWFLGELHLYKGYGGISFDPEGLYGTFTSMVNIMIGFATGRFICLAKHNDSKHLKNLGLIGILLLGIGYWLSSFNIISKPLWTSSYVLYVSGAAILLLAILIYCLDVQKLSLKFIRPSLVFGANPLLLYIVAEFVARSIDIPLQALDGESLRIWQWNKVFQHITLSLELDSFIFGVVYVLVYWALAEILYRRNLFIKI